MSQVISEVIGVIEMELDYDRFHVWMDDDLSTTVSAPIHSRTLPSSESAVVIADVTQLSEDLRQELVRILYSFDRVQ